MGFQPKNLKDLKRNLLNRINVILKNCKIYTQEFKSMLRSEGFEFSVEPGRTSLDIALPAFCQAIGEPGDIPSTFEYPLPSPSNSRN